MGLTSYTQPGRYKRGEALCAPVSALHLSTTAVQKRKEFLTIENVVKGANPEREII